MFEKRVIKKDKRINVRLTSEQDRRLSLLSEQSGRSKSQIIVDGIEDEISKFTRREEY